MNAEADEISMEDLGAAAYLHDELEREGWEAWAKRNEGAIKELGKGSRRREEKWQPVR
jgi:hypothetical protein